MAKNKKKKSMAKILYMSNYSIRDVCEMLQINQATIYRWINDEQWEEIRDERSQIQQTNEDIANRLLNKQLKRLEEMTEDNESLIQKGEIDAISKLASIAKRKPVPWEQYVKVIRELVEYVREQDLDLAKQMLEPCNQFLITQKDR